MPSTPMTIPDVDRVSPRTLALLALIVLLAAVLRFTQLNSAPVGGHGDVAWMGINALDWVDRGIWPFYVRELYAPEPFVPMLIGLLLPITGISYLPARIVTATSGVLFVALLFPAAWWLLDGQPRAIRERAGLLAALAGATSLHAMYLSRLGMESPPFLAALTLLIWLTAWAWARGGWRRWTLAGAALGLAQYVYLPARLLPLVLAVWIGHGWLADRDRLRRQWRGWLVMAVSSFVVALPALLLFVTLPGSFSARADAGTAITGGWLWNFDTSAEGGLLVILLKKIGLTLLAFGVYWNGPYTIMGQPMVGPLFALGLLFAAGILIRHPRWIAVAWPALAIPVMLITDLISGAAIEIHALHQMGVLPFTFILCGVGLAYTWEAAQPRLRSDWPRLRAVLAPALLLFGVAPALIGTYRYLNQVIPAQYADPETGWRTNQIDVDISRRITADAGRAYLLPYSEYSRSSVAWMVSAAFRERRSAINAEGTLNVPEPPAELTVVRPADPYRPRHDGYPAEPDMRLWVLLYRGQTLLLPPLTLDQAKALQSTLIAARGEPLLDGSQTQIATLYTMPTPPGLFAPRPVIDTPLDATFAGQVRLRGYTVPGMDLTPGRVIYVTLYWQALTPPAEDTDIIVQLWNDGQQSIASAQDFPYGGMYRTRLWQPGEIVATHHWLILPSDLPVGRYTLVVGLSRLLRNERLPVTGANADPALNFVKAPDLRRPQPPAVPGTPPPQAIRFGDTFELDGLDVAVNGAAVQVGQTWEAAPGQSLAVDVTWKALSRPALDYSVFLHLSAADNAPPAAQADATMGGTYPAGAWRAGDRVRDHLTLNVPAALPPGEYRVLVGVYYWQNGQRLPITLNGAKQPDDRVQIGTLIVRG